MSISLTPQAEGDIRWFDLMVYVSMGGKMTGLFRLFRFSRYQSKVWENAFASSPKVCLGVYLSKNLPGNWSPSTWSCYTKGRSFYLPIDTAVVFVHKIVKFSSLLSFYGKIHICTYTFILISSHIIEKKQHNKDFFYSHLSKRPVILPPIDTAVAPHKIPKFKQLPFMPSFLRFLWQTVETTFS